MALYGRVCLCNMLLDLSSQPVDWLDLSVTRMPVFKVVDTLQHIREACSMQNLRARSYHATRLLG